MKDMLPIPKIKGTFRFTPLKTPVFYFFPMKKNRRWEVPGATRDRESRSTFAKTTGLWQQEGSRQEEWRWLQRVHPWKLTCPLKSDHFSREYRFQPSIFRGHVSFQGRYGLERAPKIDGTWHGHRPKPYLPWKLNECPLKIGWLEYRCRCIPYW